MIAKLGVSDQLVILKKPFDNVEVLQMVQALTHKWQLLQQTKQKVGDLEKMVSERTAELIATNQTLLAEIAERKQIEQVLARERDLLQSLMDNLPDHICFKDLNSRFTRINRAHARHLGLQKPEDAIGKSDADFVSMREARQKLVDERRLLATGLPILGMVEKSETSQGTKWVSSTKVPIFGADGRITGLAEVSRDFTAYKLAELERQIMEQQLRQSQKLESIGQLAAGIAHEINTPTQYVGDNTRFVKDSFAAISKVLVCHAELLAAAKANATTPELLARNEEILAASDLDYLCEQIPSALNESLEGIERVSKIVRAMKDFSHPGDREKTPADLNRAIESTVTVAHNEWKYVADLKLELASGLPLVPCFVGEFNQCILNLIVNSAHAIGDVVKIEPGTKGLITLQTRQDGDQVEVRVTDTGTGIPEAARPKIFEPFFTTKDVGKGTGQGLSIIYGCIVKRHGGTVTFETETGKGTTFIIRLPINLKVATNENPPVPLEIQAG
jgi:PAS domain S-box-containing protein